MIDFSAVLDNTKNVIKEAFLQHPNMTFANSLSAEDMVLTDILMSEFKDISIFTIDTGRMHEQTLLLIDSIRSRYGKPIQVFFPEAQAVENFINTNGVNAFYQSVDFRKQCCHIRKVEPLKRALAGKDAWITGMRRQQSLTRTDLPYLAFDQANGLQKLNPLLDWSEAQVWHYVKSNKLPYNQLHDQNFPSIGCEPCTRAVLPGEDVRSGRWWWENPESKECGLHTRDVG